MAFSKQISFSLAGILTSLILALGLLGAYFFHLPKFLFGGLIFNHSTVFSLLCVLFLLGKPFNKKVLLDLSFFMVICVLASLSFVVFTFTSIAISPLSNISSTWHILESLLAGAASFSILYFGAVRVFKVLYSFYSACRMAILGALYIQVSHWLAFDAPSRSFISNFSFWMLIGLALGAECAGMKQGGADQSAQSIGRSQIAKWGILLLAFLPCVLFYMPVLFQFYKHDTGTCYGWMDYTEPGGFLTCFRVWWFGIDGLFVHAFTLSWIGFILLIGWPVKRASNIFFSNRIIFTNYVKAILITLLLSYGYFNIVEHFEVRSDRYYAATVDMAFDPPAKIEQLTKEEIEKLVMEVGEMPGWIKRERTGYVGLAFTRALGGELYSSSGKHDPDYTRSEIAVNILPARNKSDYSFFSNGIVFPLKSEKLSFNFERKTYENIYDKRSGALVYLVNNNFMIELDERALPGEEGELIKKFLEDLSGKLRL